MDPKLVQLDQHFESINWFLYEWRGQKHPLKVFYKKAVLKNFVIFTGKHLCWSLFLIKTPIQVFSCEYCKIFKNNYFENICQRLLLEETFKTFLRWYTKWCKKLNIDFSSTDFACRSLSWFLYEWNTDFNKVNESTFFTLHYSVSILC